ncbi:amidase [Angulomicrobium tetraedrale]|uniref:Amidase n=1 Tax=Ancylobacter tetraedralis TaxID=217068 RepID=A0A839Z7T8_9HYPH|nr:amidase [Ancylobacter tetraedralis]MBB3771211.1 amidase [Ancylobacter tetraedralis]
MHLMDLTATELSRLIATRAISPSETMAAYLERLPAVNGAINAIVSPCDPDALMSQARAMDDAPRRGWLHGLPFAVKDLVAVRGVRTTYGSPLHRDNVPEYDDLLAARLRAAGAIFTGKTNTPEWGHGSHSFNPVFGVTRNPYDTTRSAGGSSGGAAAALAARLVPVADGSDMMGSLRNPAAFCNVYGFRPSYGRVPGDADGDTFLATLATDGPMARTVEDLARLLDVLAGENPQVPFGRPAGDFAGQLKRDGRRDLRGLRVGWLGDWGGAYGCEPGILDLCEEGLGVLESLGARVERLAPPFPAEDLWTAWIHLRGFLNAGAKGAQAADPAVFAQLKPETQWEIRTGQAVSAAQVYAASVVRSRWYATAANLFRRFDILAMPAAQVWPFPAEWRWPQAINGRAMDTYHRWMEVVVPVSLLGLPSLAVPCGFGPGGLPTGMQLIGPDGGDEAVLAVGAHYHRATDWPARRPPP